MYTHTYTLFYGQREKNHHGEVVSDAPVLAVGRGGRAVWLTVQVLKPQMGSAPSPGAVAHSWQVKSKYHRRVLDLNRLLKTFHLLI